jgi:queuine/archaeosine tRNA-ribosyltransferase
MATGIINGNWHNIVKRHGSVSDFTGLLSSSVTPDTWLLNYTRITVPTFDPRADAVSFSTQKVANVNTLTAAKEHVMVWTDNGRQTLSNEAYIQAAAGLESHASVSLFDVCLPDSAQRRRRAAIQRTHTWCNEMIQRSSKNNSNKSDARKEPEILASFLIPPTVSTDEDRKAKQKREFVQKQLDDQKPSGVVFVGWQYAQELEQQQSLLKKAVQSLTMNPSSCRNLFVLSTNSLRQFLMATTCGINVIGTNLPARWAKEKKAFVCDIESWKRGEINNKRLRLEEAEISKENLDENGCFAVLSGKPDEDSNNNAIGGCWIRDAQPMLPGCTCLACQKHSRAYIYHLVKTKELLSEILLFIHNLHHMLALCRELNEASKGGKEDELHEHIQSQLGKQEV